jgi:hypothetical protein
VLVLTCISPAGPPEAERDRPENKHVKEITANLYPAAIWIAVHRSPAQFTGVQAWGLTWRTRRRAGSAVPARHAPQATGL